MIRCISLYRSGLPAVIWPGREHLTMLQSVNSESQGCDVSKHCKGHQRAKFRKLTKGKHMMLALYLTLIEYFHIFSYVFQRIKGQFLPEKLWSSQMSHAPSMICRALCTGRLEGCFCQWLKGRKESRLKIHSGRVQYKHASNEWRGNVWREIHIPASGCTGTLYIYSYYKASVQSCKEKTPTAGTKMHACKADGRETPRVVGQRVRGTQKVLMLWCICDVINQSIEAGLSIPLVYIYIYTYYIKLYIFSHYCFGWFFPLKHFETLIYFMSLVQPLCVVFETSCRGRRSLRNALDEARELSWWPNLLGDWRDSGMIVTMMYPFFDSDSKFIQIHTIY